MLGGVTRGGEGPEPQAAEIDLVAVTEALVGQFQPPDGRSEHMGAEGGQFAAAGDEVGVEMGFDRVGEVESAAFGFGEIARWVARWVDDKRSAVAEIFGARAIFSAELGASKPDPEAYRRLADRLGVAPEEILFFDDDEPLVIGARAAGLSAYQVGGAAAVRAGLAAHGLA